MGTPSSEAGWSAYSSRLFYPTDYANALPRHFSTLLMIRIRPKRVREEYVHASTHLLLMLLQVEHIPHFPGAVICSWMLVRDDPKANKV